jgi:hypothetical protein
MLERQLPPRFAVRYEAPPASKSAIPQAGGKGDTVYARGLIQEREATTLAGARRFQRALQRRGHHVQGIYERTNLRVRPSLDEDTHEYLVVCGKLDWEWDAERLLPS